MRHIPLFFMSANPSRASSRLSHGILLFFFFSCTIGSLGYGAMSSISHARDVGECEDEEDNDDDGDIDGEDSGCYSVLDGESAYDPFEDENEGDGEGNGKNIISGYKWYDHNGNGVRDGDEEDITEPVIADWEITLLDEDDNDEESLRTDGDGYYEFSELSDGEYIVCETAEEHWTQTSPTEETDGSAICDEDEGYAPWGWEVSIDEGEVVSGPESFDFGNTTELGTITIKKFNDQDGDGVWDDDEPAIEDIRFCLYPDDLADDFLSNLFSFFFPEDEEDQCKDTDTNGIVEWTDLPAGEYEVEENISDDWIPTTDTEQEVELQSGGSPEMLFGNRKPASDITAFKYFDAEDFEEEVPVRGWEICLSPWEEEDDLLGEDDDDRNCQQTDKDGKVTWHNRALGRYILDEEERTGWEHTRFSGHLEGEGFINQEQGRVVVELSGTENVSMYFYNWIDDQERPESFFESNRNHEVIQTELVALDLQGASTDAAGVRDTTLTVRQLGGPQSVASFPAQSFFDIFTEINCRNLDELEEIPIEIVALSLVSVDPMTVSWSPSEPWIPREMGMYCFEASATDNAGNIEHTAFAGPVAYVPVAQTSAQETANVEEEGFTVNWTTDKPATSRVIYDTVSHPDLGEAPNYGYTFSTSETDTDPKVTSHSVVIGGLSPGTTYYYRTVSKASPESVGSEKTTTTSSSKSPSSTNEPTGGGGHGHGSRSAHAKAEFLAHFHGVGNLPPAAFGAGPALPLSDNEVHYICSMQRALPIIPTLGLLEVIGTFVAALMDRDPAFIIDQLQDPFLCEATNAALNTTPKTVVELPIRFPIASDGFPISRNPTWNACIRGEVTLQIVRSNFDRDANGVPRDCSAYHTSTLWRHPDLNIYFTLQKSPLKIVLPAGYVFLQAHVKG